MFLHVSVILSTGGGGGEVLQAHTQGEVEGSGRRGGFQAHTQGEVGGSGWGGGLQAHTRGGGGLRGYASYCNAFLLNDHLHGWTS